MPNTDRRVLSNDPSSKCGTDFGSSFPFVSKVANFEGYDKFSELIYYFLQVSYGASSSLLNDSSMYNTFFRTCPSNRHLAISLAAIIAHFGWSCINIVSSRESGSYLGIAQDLKQELKHYNLCVAIDEVAGSYDEIPGIIFKIRRRTTVTVSVLLGSDDYVAHIFDEIRNKNLTKRIWIGINIPRIDNTFVIDGSLWISTPAEDLGELGSYIKEVSTDISGAYFKGLAANRYRPENFTQSNFLYLQRFPWDKIVYVMNSVLAIASGLESVKPCRHGDPHCSNCLEENFTLSYVRNLLLRQLEGSSFVENRDVYVSFNKNRELNAEFDILNLRIADNSTLTSFRVGKTTRHRGLEINASEIRWPGNEPEVPYSECWERCPSGSYTENYFGVCWWSCHKCPHGTYNSNSTSTLCSACPKEQMTNGLQSACVDKPLIIMKAGEFLAVIFLSACGLGEMLTLLVIGVFVRYHVTPVVKAANLTLSLLSLIVLLAWFLIPGLYIGQPTNVTCSLRAVVFAVLYTAITSVLLTKTNRVIKIFSAINVKKHRFLSNYWYGFLTCALIIIQLGICALHLLIFPPKLVYDYSVSDALLVQCNANLGFDVTAFGYNIFLSLTCCVLAYQSRKLPSAYTEFKWIFLAMFTNISSWLIILINSHAWPSTKGNLICTIMALMVGAYAMLFLLFLPKVRVIFFRPEKNTKQAAIESTRRYSLEQASGIDLSPVQGSDQRRNSSPACLAMQFMKGSIGKLPVIKNNLGSRRSQSSKITTINECSEERKTSI